MMTGPDRKNGRLLGVYGYADDVVRLIRILRDRKLPIEDIFSPIRNREMQVALGKGRSIVAFFTLLGGIVGGVGLICLAVWAHTSFNLITWGKPILAWIPWVIVCFEGMVLFAVLFSFVSWILAGRLPTARLPASYDPIFSGDKFGLVVAYAEGERQEVYQILDEAGAEEIRDLNTPDQGDRAVLNTETTNAL